MINSHITKIGQGSQSNFLQGRHHCVQAILTSVELRDIGTAWKVTQSSSGWGLEAQTLEPSLGLLSPHIRWFAFVIRKKNWLIRCVLVLKCGRVEDLQKEKLFGDYNSFESYNGDGASGIFISYQNVMVP